MFTSQPPAYFAFRTRSTWIYIGLSVLTAMVAAQFGASQTYALLAGSVFYLPVFHSVFVSHRERNGDKSPAPASAWRQGERRQLKAAPLLGWLEQVKHNMPFEDFVTELGACSNLYGRRFSVTCVKIAALSEEKAERVASLLRQSVRMTDEVRRVGDDEFIVCTPLLRDALAANIVFARLRDALLKSSLLEADNMLRLGKAVYPRDGYTGADLIQSARAALRTPALQPR